MSSGTARLQDIPPPGFPRHSAGACIQQDLDGCRNIMGFCGRALLLQAEMCSWCSAAAGRPECGLTNAEKRLTPLPCSAGSPAGGSDGAGGACCSAELRSTSGGELLLDAVACSAAASACAFCAAAAAACCDAAACCAAASCCAFCCSAFRASARRTCSHVGSSPW